MIISLTQVILKLCLVICLQTVLYDIFLLIISFVIVWHITFQSVNHFWLRIVLHPLMSLYPPTYSPGLMQVFCKNLCYSFPVYCKYPVYAELSIKHMSRNIVHNPHLFQSNKLHFLIFFSRSLIWNICRTNDFLKILQTLYY